MILLAALFAGILFGIGLVVSQMADPTVVLGFLDLFGNWDPRLIFVMASAIPVTFIGYAIILKKKTPLFEQHFSLPVTKNIDKKLVIGSIIFGIGWGLSGYCPGPAIVGLSINPSETIVFVISMLGGILIFNKTVK